MREHYELSRSQEENPCPTLSIPMTEQGLVTHGGVPREPSRRARNARSAGWDHDRGHGPPRPLLLVYGSWEEMPWHSTSTTARPGRGSRSTPKGMKLGDHLPNPTDRHSFHQLADAGDGRLQPQLHQCSMETATVQQVFNPKLNVCDSSDNLSNDASIYEYCLQQGWLERDQR